MGVSTVFRRGRWDDAHWDVDELNEVTNETHDGETNGDCLGDLDELCNSIGSDAENV